MKKLACSVAAVMLSATALLAQQTQPSSSELPKLTESIEVRVINVDVVVTDKRGNPIRGLTKDDFELYENGAPKPISNFYEVEGPKTVNQTAAEPNAKPAAPQEIPRTLRRRIIFYIDNLSLQPFNRNRVFKAMKQFAKESMRPGDEAMIATFNRSMKVRVPFTSDVTEIQQMLDTIAGESALGLANKSDAHDAEQQINDAQSYDDAVAYARTYAESVNHDLRQSVESLDALMSTLAGVEGKKILVLTTEGFQMQPGREMFYLIDELGRQKGWQPGGTLLEGMAFDATNQIQDIAKTANANGITIYAIHAGGLAAMTEGMSAENAQPTPQIVTDTAISNSTESLQLIADMTGGLAAINTNNFTGAFQNIENDLNSYYSLGYRAGTERIDRQRSIEVRLKKNPNHYIVRSRQSFVEKSTVAEMNDRVVANLLYNAQPNDLHIVITTGTPKASQDLYDVPLEIHIPMNSLTLLPQGNGYVGGFSVYVAVANKDGDMSDVTRQSHQIHVSPEEFKTINGKYYTYSLDLLMERGLGRISVGVVDEISNTTGFAKQSVIAQDLQ